MGVVTLLILLWPLLPKPPTEPFRTAQVTRGDLTR